MLKCRSLGTLPGESSFAFSPPSWSTFFKGIKSSGNVVYFTGPFPYVNIIMLLVRAATQEGTIQVLDLTKGSYSIYNCDHRVSITTSSRTGPSWPPSRSGVCTDAAGQILSSLSAGNATTPTLQQVPQGQFQIILGFFLVITLECVICVCNILTFNREKAVWVSADIVEKLCSHKRKRQFCARGVGYC